MAHGDPGQVQRGFQVRPFRQLRVGAGEQDGTLGQAGMQRIPPERRGAQQCEQIDVQAGLLEESEQRTRFETDAEQRAAGGQEGGLRNEGRMLGRDVHHRGLGVFQRQQVGEVGAGRADDDREAHSGVGAQHQAHGLARGFRAGGFAQRRGDAAGALQETACQLGGDVAGLGAQDAGEFVRGQDREAALREVGVVGAEGGDGVRRFGRAAEQAAIELDHVLIGDHATTAS